jgi:hypothetical protein
MSEDLDMIKTHELPGFPMTILFRATPLAASWKTAVFGHSLDDAVRRLEHVVYSFVPSVRKVHQQLVRVWTQPEDSQHTVVELDVILATIRQHLVLVVGVINIPSR